MLTPVDLQNKVFKGGIGFDKKDVEAFMRELSSDYEQLYRSNVELTDKVTTLNESLQHYKSVEDSMQKALTLSEKTAEETVHAANDKARLLTTEAEKKAESILADAKQELSDTKNEIFRLQQQQKKFKEQFTKVLESQLKLMDGEMIDIDLGSDFEPMSRDSGFGNFSGGGLGSEGGLGGGLGGGYVGNNGNNFERTNQDPAFDRGTLNMDPFANAANGGRFSRQTGGAYNKNTRNTAASKTDSNKSTLNVKQENPDSRRVKRAPAPTDTPKTEPTVTATKQPEPSTNSVVREPQKTSAASTVKQDSPEKSAEREKVQQTAFEQKVTPNVPHKSNVATDEAAVSGEVESKMNESTMLDSEDNYTDGFDFVEEDVTFTQTSAASDVFTEEPVTGEVEIKIDESTMLDSEDNYGSGFDFVEEDNGSSVFISDSDEETYSGEVEDKINESTMLDSEDNYTDGFDFIVGNEQEEEIPTISGGQTSLNLDPFGENNSALNDDVLVGDVEDKLDESTLLGNDDDAEEGFNFL